MPCEHCAACVQEWGRETCAKNQCVYKIGCMCTISCVQEWGCLDLCSRVRGKRRCATCFHKSGGVCNQCSGMRVCVCAICGQEWGCVCNLHSKIKMCVCATCVQEWWGRDAVQPVFTNQGVGATCAQETHYVCVFKNKACEQSRALKYIHSVYFLEPVREKGSVWEGVFCVLLERIIGFRLLSYIIPNLFSHFPPPNPPSSPAQQF